MTGMWYAMESDSTAYAGHTIVHAFGAPTLMRQRITERGILWVKRSVSSCQNKKALPFIVSGTSWVRCVVPDVELQQTSRGASKVSSVGGRQRFRSRVRVYNHRHIQYIHLSAEPTLETAGTDLRHTHRDLLPRLCAEAATV